MRAKKQFEQLRATELYCPECRKLQPVRERLLLVLPQAELYDYRCVSCGSSLGSREVRAPAQPLVLASSLPPRH
ncbi:MAG: cytoplasmic protein [Lentisphaerae bacterium]|nr:cytoplasmic protein [Lentisphaerota bacterium]